MISHCHHEYSYVRHITSALKSIKVFNLITTKSQKLNSSKQDKEGETPYDPTILTKLAIHQDRAKSRTQERERDQTHSYWYIPSASRVNYSLVMDSAGMMKMATSEGSPLRQGAGMGSQEVFGGYRGLRQRNFRSILISDVFRVRGNI